MSLIRLAGRWRRALVASTALGLAIVLCAGRDAAAQPTPPTSAQREYASSWEEYQALKAKAHGGTQHTPATLPDWSGIWRREGNPESMDSSGIVAALTPKYRAAYDRKRANYARDILWDRLSWCLPAGMPRWLADPWLREYIATPKETWMLYEQLEEVRRVYTDGREHVPESVAIPLWEGDSIGFWDGDTLVVHTNHIKAGEYWRGSPETSFEATTVERVRRVSPDVIEHRLTVYDPISLTRPVRLTFSYTRQKDPDIRINYDSCEEGNNAVRTAEGGTSFVLPGEPGYRDPVTFGIPDVALDSLPR